MGSKKNLNFKKEIKKHIEGSINVKEKIIDKYIDVINDAVKAVIDAYQNNKKVLWCGNGGSAADAQHLSCELVSKFYLNRKAMRSIALTTNTSTLTAISNDFSYDRVFERQVEALADEGDVLIGITTSGNSKNIINALKTANEKGAVTIAMTGENVDEIQDYADYLMSVPSDVTPHIQESHIMIGHIICYLVEKTLFGDESWETEQSLSTEMEQ
ncbi:MAG: D-sedoheptulose 7-phosphate isomerase [Thermoplasmatales archaeon]|nr:D-sedoheptulose 7-phosphate isomerase [Thermoplasmatales archaeon]